jgi:hypothetical protein
VSPPAAKNCLSERDSVVNLRAQNARLTKKGGKKSSTLETLQRIFSHAVSLRRRRVTGKAAHKQEQHSHRLHAQARPAPTKVNSPALSLHLSNRPQL